MMTLLNKLPFAHKPWFMYACLLVRHFLADNCTQKSASLTYTTLLSIVPMLAILLVIFSTVPALEGVREQVQNAIYSNLLPSSGVQVSSYIDKFAQNSARFTVVGIGVLLFTTVSMLITIETAFNQIWRIEERTGGLDSIVRYVLMIVGLPVVLAVAFTATSAIASVDFLNRQIGGYGIDWAIWAKIFSFGFTVLGFIGMYFFIPKVKVPFKNALIAGLVVAVLFECVRQLFGLVISNFTSYEAIYGAFAILPVFLMWIYVSWNLILLGVEISYTLTIFEPKEVPVRHPLLSLLDMLNVIYKNHKYNKTTSENALRAVLGRKETPKWQTYIRQLEQSKLIIKKSDNYTLRTNLDSMTLWQFYRSLPYPLPIKDELIKLEQAHYDPWYDALYQELKIVERHTKQTLSTPLSSLFDGTLVRQKEEIIALDQTHSQANDTRADVLDDVASFDESATAQTDNQNSEDVLIPTGKARLKLSTLPKPKQLMNKGKSLFQKAKQRFKK